MIQEAEQLRVENERLRAENDSLKQGVRLSDLNLEDLRDRTLYRIRLGRYNNTEGRMAAKLGINCFIDRLKRRLQPHE